MYNLLRDLIGFTMSGNYMQTHEAYIVCACCAFVIIGCVVLLDFWRLLFRAIINKIR